MIMVKPPLAELSYLFIKEKFGFKPNVYHDKYGIPSIGTGIKFFTHNKITRKYRLKSKIGTVSRQEFIKILFNTTNTNNAYVKSFEKSLKKESILLNRGLKPDVRYYEVNLSENDYLKNIWHGKVNLYGSILQETKEKISVKI